MKNILFASFITLLVTACSNDKTTESNESAPVTPGADNVNGNIQDTSNSIRLNQPLPKDSSGMNDSTR